MLCNVSILAFLFLTWDLPCTIFYCFLISLVIKVSMINERSYTAKLLVIYHIISVRLELLLFSYETSRALSEHFLNLLSGMLCGQHAQLSSLSLWAQFMIIFLCILMNYLLILTSEIWITYDCKSGFTFVYDFTWWLVP